MLNVYKYKDSYPLVLEGLFGVLVWLGSVGWKVNTHGKGGVHYSARKISMVYNKGQKPCSLLLLFI